MHRKKLITKPNKNTYIISLKLSVSKTSIFIKKYKNNKGKTEAANNEGM